MSHLLVQPSTAADRPAIRDILLRSGLFGPHDADVVDEMFGHALAKPAPDNYRFLSGWLDGAMRGFACFGHEALTHGTWDLFWVCTVPEARGHGLGGALLREAVRVAAAENGRLIVIYTSSTALYAPARRLYESQDFFRMAVIPEYYNRGDDLYIYGRRLQRDPSPPSLQGVPSAGQANMQSE